MIKSRARMFLESLREDDSSLDGDQDMMMDAPADAPADEPALEEPAEDMDAAVAGMTDPEHMAEALDSMDGQMDRYMDEEDMEVFTPADDAQKECLQEARGYMREAAGKLRSMRK